MMGIAEELHKLGVVVGANLLRIGPHRYLAELRQDLATLGGKVQILLSEPTPCPREMKDGYALRFVAGFSVWRS